MPIHIRCRDKPPDRHQAIEHKGANTLSPRNPTTRYAGRKAKPRILCGSI